jgi:hypothetical membrane protein
MAGTFTGGTTRGIAAGAENRPAPRLEVILGGAAWIVATLQYAIVQVVVAAAWHHPPYSWLGNYISDLGNTVCGRFTVPHGTPAYVCSPMHSAMNASFIITGILTIAGALLLRSSWPRSRATTVALVLWVITGLGKIVVGLVPENTNISLHLLAAFNVRSAASPSCCSACRPARPAAPSASPASCSRSSAWQQRCCPPRPNSPASHPSTSGCGPAAWSGSPTTPGPCGS